MEPEGGFQASTSQKMAKKDLVQDPRQPRTYTRETNEDGAEAHEYFHFHQTRGRSGHHCTRQV